MKKVLFFADLNQFVILSSVQIDLTGYIKTIV